MARLPRLSPEGIPIHLIQRGNNREVCFVAEEDFGMYIKWLKEYSEKFNVDVHAWVLMTNHVHILATPNEPNAISNMMQSVGRMYVRYFNHQYQRTGTLWEGRFKSCLVQSERYLLVCSRYIELNPVRASMVADPAEYKWSSYQANALGKASDLLTPHEEYQRLGTTDYERQKAYRALFKTALNGEVIDSISKLTEKGLALGNDRFKDQIEALHERRVRSAMPGRPRRDGNKYK